MRDEDFKTGITKFGVTDYAAPAPRKLFHLPHAQPFTFEHDDDAIAALDFDAPEEMLRLM